MAWPAIAIAGGSALLGALRGGQKQKAPTTTAMPYDPRLYEYTDPERDYVAGMSLDMLDNMYSGAFGGGYGPGGGGGGGGWGISGGGASSGGGAASATADKIDMNEWIYQQTAPDRWMDDVTSRATEFMNAQLENNLLGLRDQSIRGGLGADSPAFAWIAAEEGRKAREQMANTFRDAEISWVLPAADRRHAGLNTNADLGTRVNITNAQLAEAARARAMQASIANAQMRQAASAQSAQLDFQRQGLLWKMMQDTINPSTSMGVYSQQGYQDVPGTGGIGGAIKGAIGGGMVGYDLANQMGLMGGGGGGSWEQYGNSYGAFPSGGNDYGTGTWDSWTAPGRSNYVEL